LLVIHVRVGISDGVGSTEIGDMDHDEAVKLLNGGREGIAEWNRRRDHGEEIPDFSFADLAGADLSRANLFGALSRADLGGANLNSAKLSNANLSRADLSNAKLTGADLTGACLSGANFCNANFTGANLKNANLIGAYLIGASLSSANLSRANLGGANLMGATLSGTDLVYTNLSAACCLSTVFANLDLSNAKGLDSVNHRGPSTIGIDTLFRSEGRIPDSFLRGCGVPDALIKYLPSIIGSMDPIQFYSCFISYSSKDRSFAERLYADLQVKGVRCWLDKEDLKSGEKFRDSIDAAIRVHDKLMVVLTKHSIASEWVETEVETALARERREKRTILFPIRLDSAILKTSIPWASHLQLMRHIGDFTGWTDPTKYDKAFGRLLSELKAEEPTSPAAPSPRASRPKKPH
jgi:TIR domain/Pentapeptide repeats (8 copies)